MGTLYYGASRLAIRIDDRTLAHLRVVATAKLRRNEPFLISWANPVGAGSGRESLWLHPGIDLVYQLDGPSGAVDSALLDSMMAASFLSRGIEIEATRLTS